MASSPESWDLLANLEKDLGHTREIGIEEFAETTGRTLYPNQLLLLKLIFLEELSDEEEATLDHWIAGGRNGTEVIISPYIRERIQWCRDNDYPHFREIVLVGGRRSGKGHITATAFAYKMYSLIDTDVRAKYNIPEEKAIYFSCLAVSQDQAKSHQYADFSSAVASCPLMQDNIYKIRELEFSILTENDKRRLADLKRRDIKIGRDISQLRGVALAANAKTVRGSATLACAFDEIAHMQQEGDSYMTASNVYDAIQPSLAQFGQNSLCMLNSSPYTKLGQFYEKYLEGMSAIETGPAVPSMFSFLYPSWTLFEHPRLSKKPRRDVQMASPDWDPDEADDKGNYIWSPNDRGKIRTAKIDEQSDPEKFRVEFRSQWAEVVDAFLQPAMVERSFMGKPVERGGYIPFNVNWSNPLEGHQYYAHLDPSSTTAGFGFALAHMEQVEEKNQMTGENEVHDHIFFDIIKRWRPQDFISVSEGLNFDYEWVLEEMAYWFKVFRPKEISSDQFGFHAIQAWFSKWARQNHMEGMTVIEKTATNKLNWVTGSSFRDALYLDRVHFPSDTPDCNYLELELKNLQQVNTQGNYAKIEAPSVGPVQTKDLYSCLHRDTEILTRQGWKTITDVGYQDEVATRSEEGILEYHHPTMLHQKFSEELVICDNTKLKFAVTPDHNMVTLPMERNASGHRFIQAQEMQRRGSVYRIPKQAILPHIDSGDTIMIFPTETDEIVLVDKPIIPDGYCHCGCGQKAPLAKRTRGCRGEWKNKPRLFIPRHGRKWTSEEDKYLDESYATVPMALMEAELDKTTMAIYNRAKLRGLAKQNLDRYVDRPAQLPEVSLRLFAKFLGFWYGDGLKHNAMPGRKSRTGYATKLVQSKSIGVEWVDNLLKEMNWPYIKRQYRDDLHEWWIFSYELREYLRALQDGHELIFPNEVFTEWDTKTKWALMEGLFMSDGNSSCISDRYSSFTNTSKRLVDQVQHLATELGMATSVYHQELTDDIVTFPGNRTHKRNYEIWRVLLHKGTNHWLEGKRLYREAYNDDAYCVTVPNNTILIRWKNKTAWVGNCVSTLTYTLIGNTAIRGMREAIGAAKPAFGAKGGYRIGQSIERRSLDSLMPNRGGSSREQGWNDNFQSVYFGNYSRSKRRYR